MIVAVTLAQAGTAQAAPAPAKQTDRAAAAVSGIADGAVASSRSVELPTSASAPFVLDTGKGKLKISAPARTAAASARSLAAGTRLYAGAAEASTLAAQALGDGSL